MKKIVLLILMPLNDDFMLNFIGVNWKKLKGRNKIMLIIKILVRFWFSIQYGAF